MTRGAELAIEVLLGEGLIVRKGSWYEFVGEQPVEVRAIQQESRAVIVTPGKLPWLEVREVKQGDYLPTTKQGRLFCALKMGLGLDWRDRAYDAAMYKRSIRALNQLLAAFQTEQEAAEYVLAFGDQMREAGIENWGVDAVVRSAYNSKGQREQMK